MKNTFGLILSFIGCALVLVGTRIAFYVMDTTISAPSNAGRMYGEWSPMWLFLAVAAGISGAVFAIIGGLLAKPGSLWIVYLSVGSIYCIPVLILIVLGISKEISVQGWRDSYLSPLLISSLLYLLPGIILTTEAVLIRLVAQGTRKQYVEAFSNQPF